MRRAPHILIIALMGLGLISCEEARLREDPLGQATNPQQRAMRALLSQRGLAALLTRTLGEQRVAIRGSAAGVVGDETLQLGPVTQDVAMGVLDVVPLASTLDATLTLPETTLLIPTRRASGAQTQICRWRVRVTSASVSWQLAISPEADGYMLRVDRAPLVQLEDPQVALVGSCADPTLSAADEALRQELVGYARQVIAESIAQAVEGDPIAGVSLISRSLELTRLSAFEHRRGQLLLTGQPSSGNPVRLSADGLTLEMDYALQSRNARCVPPIGPAPVEAILPTPISPALLRQFDADVGLSLNAALLNRALQALTLSGFMCRGLEQPIAEDPAGFLLKELRLGDVGVDASLAAERVSVALSPGGLPSLQLSAESGVIRMTVPDLVVTIHGEVFGVRSRLAEVTLSVQLSLRPTAQRAAGVLGLAVETIEVTAASLSSEWRASEAALADATLQQWARRLLVLVFGQETVLPLPLEPDNGLIAVGAQVRANDMIVLLRFGTTQEGAP